MNKITTLFIFLLIIGCQLKNPDQSIINGVKGIHQLDTSAIWLTHEHLMVDFIGADSIRPASWDHDTIIKTMLPFLEELKAYNVVYFVDATPNYLGRDAILLEKLALKSGINIITNTGLYGAVEHKYLPDYVQESIAEALAEDWIDEFNNGINGTTIKPGFIKISVNNSNPLRPIDEKIVRAAAITHLKTGLTIASHTGRAAALWPQLQILEEIGVSPKAFIWVHAQNENDLENYLKAAAYGCWISLDGVNQDIRKYIEKLLFAKQNQILDQVLISHDAGWFDPQKETQSIRPYTTIFTELIPELRKEGFSEFEINKLLKVNPVQAFSTKIRAQ